MHSRTEANITCLDGLLQLLIYCRNRDRFENGTLYYQERDVWKSDKTFNNYWFEQFEYNDCFSAYIFAIWA